jgi:hypothetical protein
MQEAEKRNITFIDFHSDTLIGVECVDGQFVAVKPIVQSIGLDWKAQHRRISQDPILSEGMVVVAIPSPGGVQETGCLRIDLVPGWLFTIDDSRIKNPNVLEKVLTYKRECYAVLFHHFHGKAIAPTPIGDKDAELSVERKESLINTACRVGGSQAGAVMWLRFFPNWTAPTIRYSATKPHQMELPEITPKSEEPSDGE